jgi:transcriptional regulator with XRE-family HTH domain
VARTGRGVRDVRPGQARELIVRLRRGWNTVGCAMPDANSTSTVGDRLSHARRRAGLTREQLAVASGLSWAAITQIETGRRANPRADTLRALATALDVTVEYLVGGSSRPSVLLDHYAVIYGDLDELVRASGPVLADGMAAGDATLVVTDRGKTDALREHLGAAASAIRFEDAHAFYTSPPEALRGLRSFADGALEAGAPWVRIVGEPIWEGRSSDQINAWARYEAMLNLAFAARPMTVACLYDATGLDGSVVGYARATHCRCVEHGENTVSRDFADPLDYCL